jgi:hypothetical protein
LYKCISCEQNIRERAANFVAYTEEDVIHTSVWKIIIYWMLIPGEWGIYQKWYNFEYKWM